jgi:hypothetical protein
MRKLVAIVIAGVAVAAIAVYFARSSDETAHQQLPEVPKHDVAVDVPDTRAQLPSNTREKSPPAAPMTAEQQERAACNALSERRLAREQAALDAEPKDAAWAYPMEQKLREYVTQTLVSGQLEVIGIDCRTTFCEIKALLLDPEGSTEFNNAISGARGKSWNDFTGIGTSPSEESGKTIYSGKLLRRQFQAKARDVPEEAQAEAACTARIIEKQDRERAARDAQPKDPTWAEPMEQLIRQYLTTQVKQPVEQIDIDCRTSYCRINAKGRTNDAAMAFQKAAQAVADEPWANLRNGEGGGSGYGDSWEQHYVLYRR